MAQLKLFLSGQNINFKSCNRCKAVKPLEHFSSSNRNAIGLQTECRLCHSERHDPAVIQRRKEMAELAFQGLKRCNTCHGIKVRSDFNKSKIAPDGLSHKCRECSKVINVEWRKNNPEGFRTWYSKNKVKVAPKRKQWRDSNTEHRRQYISKWSKNNKHLINRNIAKRRAAKIAACPAWANQKAIADIYAEAARMRRDTGLRYEVDHIVPLQNAKVCGLHWEGNLQIILKHENISKLNRRWPGMA